jgi:hypothetical protein
MDEREQMDLEIPFSGSWIPDYVWELLWRGEITAEEMVIMLYIQVEAEEGTNGCSMTDRAIAERLHLDRKVVKKAIIRQLKARRLVRIGPQDARRCVQVFWDPELCLARNAPELYRELKDDA